jgi:hypothetical protein
MSNEMGPNETGSNEMGPNEIGPNETGSNEMGPNEIGPNETMLKCVLFILNTCNISCKTIHDMDGLVISREFLINDDKYNNIQTEMHLIKKLFSSSYLTSLQSSAQNKQKWPLLNLIRQLLRSCNFKLTPKRVANGYSITGEKNYKRLFVIEKMKL